ncbi:MAG: cyclophilin-like fold protein [Desulfobacteraceae bacterium]
MEIRITAGDLTISGELNDSPTARMIAEALPFATRFNTWGEEIYFPIPVEAGLDQTAREVVEAGDLGYWPEGRAFCIFFGPTPMSSPGKIVPASAVNVIGRVHGDPARFKEVMDAESITVAPARE